jgi:hypothetical protein
LPTTKKAETESRPSLVTPVDSKGSLLLAASLANLGPRLGLRAVAVAEKLGDLVAHRHDFLRSRGRGVQEFEHLGLRFGGTLRGFRLDVPLPSFGQDLVRGLDLRLFVGGQVGRQVGAGTTLVHDRSGGGSRSGVGRSGGIGGGSLTILVAHDDSLFLEGLKFQGLRFAFLVPSIYQTLALTSNES